MCPGCPSRVFRNPAETAGTHSHFLPPSLWTKAEVLLARFDPTLEPDFSQEPADKIARDQQMGAPVGPTLVAICQNYPKPAFSQIQAGR